MILQALYEYAQRKGDALPEDGFENIEFKYLIEIRKDGSFVKFRDMQEKDDNGKLKGKTFTHLPKRIERSGKTPKASLLLDNVGYVLGIPKRVSETDSNFEKNQKKANESAKIQNEAFISRIENLPDDVKSDEHISAVIKFYRDNKANGFDKISTSELWQNIQKTTSNITFILEFENELIPQIEVVSEYQRKQIALESGTSEESEDNVIGICLVTGENAKIARLHAATSIIGAKSNAKFVGFQKNSGYDSYGKEQSYNAPVSIKAESAYTKALNYLTKHEKAKNNRFRLGEDTVVFWAEEESSEDFENGFGLPFSFANEDNPDKNVIDLKNLLNSINSGKYRNIDSNFYVLGLSPNAARISVRFWETGKVETFAKRIKQHFDDFEIVKNEKLKEYLTLFDILSSTALGKTPKERMDNVAPNLIGNMMQSILKGLPYPAALQQQCIRRIRAEQKVTRERAAILKAYINRINRINGKEEVTVSLNRECKDKGYLVGRLFAVLEKVQQDTHPGLNATITDRFYGAASTSPVTVFSQLLKLNQHHLANYDNKGLRVIREKEIGEIISMLESFPSHLDLNQQSMFAIGYYHEKEDLWGNKITEENK